MAGEQDRCIQELPHPKIKLHDPGTGKSVVLLNPGKATARHIRWDHCLAPAGISAADFIVSIPRIVDVIVELKGRNVDHAAEQVETTWAAWSRHAKRVPDQLISGWILCKQYPRSSQKIKRAQEHFRKHGGKLIFSTHNGEERTSAQFVPGNL